MNTRYLMTASLIALLGTADFALARGGHGHGHGHGGAAFAPIRGAVLPPEQSALDTNGDGRISYTELKAARAAEFTTIDGNTDGFVSFAELQAGLEKKQADAYSAQDTDASGGLSLAEFTETDAGLRAKVFALADTNQDGILSAAESAALHPVFPHAVREFSVLDDDDDNQISSDEYQVSMGLPIVGGHHGGGLSFR